MMLLGLVCHGSSGYFAVARFPVETFVRKRGVKIEKVKLVSENVKQRGLMCCYFCTSFSHLHMD